MTSPTSMAMINRSNPIISENDFHESFLSPWNNSSLYPTTLDAAPTNPGTNGTNSTFYQEEIISEKFENFLIAAIENSELHPPHLHLTNTKTSENHNKNENEIRQLQLRQLIHFLSQACLGLIHEIIPENDQWNYIFTSIDGRFDDIVSIYLLALSSNENYPFKKIHISRLKRFMLKLLSHDSAPDLYIPLSKDKIFLQNLKDLKNSLCRSMSSGIHFYSIELIQNNLDDYFFLLEKILVNHNSISDNDLKAFLKAELSSTHNINPLPSDSYFTYRFMLDCVDGYTTSQTNNSVEEKSKSQHLIDLYHIFSGLQHSINLVDILRNINTKLKEESQDNSIIVSRLITLGVMIITSPGNLNQLTCVGYKHSATRFLDLANQKISNQSPSLSFNQSSIQVNNQLKELNKLINQYKSSSQKKSVNKNIQPKKTKTTSDDNIHYVKNPIYQKKIKIKIKSKHNNLKKSSSLEDISFLPIQDELSNLQMNNLKKMNSDSALEDSTDTSFTEFTDSQSLSPPSSPKFSYPALSSKSPHLSTPRKNSVLQSYSSHLSHLPTPSLTSQSLTAASGSSSPLSHPPSPKTQLQAAAKSSSSFSYLAPSFPLQPSSPPLFFSSSSWYQPITIKSNFTTSSFGQLIEDISNGNYSEIFTIASTINLLFQMSVNSIPIKSLIQGNNEYKNHTETFSRTCHFVASTILSCDNSKQAKKMVTGWQTIIQYLHDKHNYEAAHAIFSGMNLISISRIYSYFKQQITSLDNPFDPNGPHDYLNNPAKEKILEELFTNKSNPTLIPPLSIVRNHLIRAADGNLPIEMETGRVNMERLKLIGKILCSFERARLFWMNQNSEKSLSNNDDVKSDELKKHLTEIECDPESEHYFDLDLNGKGVKLTFEEYLDHLSKRIHPVNSNIYWDQTT